MFEHALKKKPNVAVNFSIKFNDFSPISNPRLCYVFDAPKSKKTLEQRACEIGRQVSSNIILRFDFFLFKLSSFPLTKGSQTPY